MHVWHLTRSLNNASKDAMPPEQLYVHCVRLDPFDSLGAWSFRLLTKVQKLNHGLDISVPKTLTCAN
jgi:hypothetical protein